MDQTTRKIYTTSQRRNFSTDALKLQISAHKKYALSGDVSLSDKRKNKSDSRANLLFLTQNVLLNFRWAFEGNILFETGFEFRDFFSSLEGYLGKAPLHALVNIPVAAQRRTF